MNLYQDLSKPSASKRNLAVAGVMLVIFLFAIDATIVSTSMPTIVARLGGLELYSWVFSIYMLTSALTTPLFGKLADLFSHRRLMLIGIGIFVLGSTLCGAAQSMEMLVFFRAIQGLGGGAIYALAFIVVGGGMDYSSRRSTGSKRGSTAGKRSTPDLSGFPRQGRSLGP